MATNLYDLKMKMSTVGAQLKNIEEDLVAKLADPAIPIEEIQNLKAKKADLQERFDTLKEAHDRLEAQEREKIKQNPVQNAKTSADKIVAAKAEFIRAKVLGRPMSPEAQEILGEDITAPLIAIPVGGDNKTGGENLLPTTQSKEIIAEPFVRNPLRGKITMTSIAGLELPKIAFELDEDSFITDVDAANEIKATGDKVFRPVQI